MEIIILGGGNFVWSVLSWAKTQAYACSAITNSEQAEKRLTSTGLCFRQTLDSNGIPYVITETPEGLNVWSNVESTGEPLLLSYGAPWIIKKGILENVFRNKLLNIHGTRLPRERGGTLFSWQILSGQRTGMALIHKMTEKLDEGPIVAHEEFIYPASCRKPIDYLAFYEEKNLEFLKAFIQSFQNVPHQLLAQPEYLSTYWPRLLASVHGWINWSWSVTEIERLICAFDDPYAGARCRWNNMIVLIKDTWAQATDGYTHPFQNGLVYRNNNKWINVAANGGELLICRITDLDGNDILPQFKTGDRLYTLPTDLTQSYQRVVKTKQGLIPKSF